MEVISHTGIPVELLSDQGSVFLGKVIKELCRLLNIKQIKTTAYHPQTNGILERWHSCLKGMIRKIQGKSQQWDKLLKYCLLAYRATPHTATGFSPYELVHGKSMRGPLEAVKAGWIGGDISFTSTVEWVQALRETLVALHKVAHANEEVAKDKSKTAYDVGSKARSFEPGDLVLCHTPGLTGKLRSIWDGPYEVVAKLSNCNYTIAVKGKRSKHTTVHINRLIAWKIPTANLFQVVVADEFEVNPEPIGKVKMFYQVPLSRRSQDKTAFCTPWGKYAFTRMPFGLKNAPAAFQRCMQNTLAHVSVYSSAYIDDILIYSKNWEDHLDHIEAVLLALREAGLTANPDKCVWGAKSNT